MSEHRDIFISFSNQNKDKVEKIVETIKFFWANMLVSIKR